MAAKVARSSSAKSASRSSSAPWPDHLHARLLRLRQQLRKLQLDALLINHPPDIQYLTGFSGEDSWALVTRTQVIALSDRRFEEELADHHPYVRAVMRPASLAEALEPVARSVKRLGVQAEHLSLSARKSIVKHRGSKRLVETQNVVLDLRAVKDTHEISLIQQAVRIQEQAFAELLRVLKPGMMERQIAALLEYRMRELGADEAAFKTIVGADANASIPHYRPAGAKMKKNGIVLIDFGARVGGYCSDMTRVVALGKMPPKIKEIYQVVRAAHQAGIEAIGPGVSLPDVDKAARQVIEDAGYGKQFGHGLGHGIGLEIHEAPRLSNKATGKLEPGHIVTVEPGIYLPGIGGVRLEDDVLVTATGRRNLCSLPTDLDSAII
jgi:Xaa-Pro aminopeptidase